MYRDGSQLPLIRIAIEHAERTRAPPREECIHAFVSKTHTDGHAANDIGETNEDLEEGRARVCDGDGYRLQIVLEENSRRHASDRLPGLLGDGILIRRDTPAARAADVGCWHDGKKVLETVKG